MGTYISGSVMTKVIAVTVNAYSTYTTSSSIVLYKYTIIYRGLKQ